MALTVGDVVGLDVVQQGAPRVLSGRRFDAAVRWVHIGDAADVSAVLQGGELVLTTGAGLNSSPQQYLEGLADVGALGVVVELGTALAEVPARVVALAEELDLALVALGRQIKFVAVTEAVHRRIVAAQYEEVTFDRRVHEVFTELTMKRASVTAIVDAAARMLDEPVVLEDLAHQALAVGIRGGRVASSLLDDWEKRSRMTPPAGGGLEAWAATAVGPRGQEWGRLIVPQEPTDRSRAMMVLERAAVALALHRMIEKDRTGLHQQAQSGLIDDVLQSRITDERDVAARAHALGLRRSARYLPVAVRVDRLTENVDPVSAQRRNVSMLDAVRHTVNSAGHTGLFAIRRDGEIAILLSLDTTRGGTDKALTSLGRRLGADLHRLDGVTRAVCAVSDAAAGIIDSIQQLDQASHVAEVAIALQGEPRPFYRASDVRLRGLISLLRNDPHVQQFAETELKALLVNDDSGDSPLLEVLRQYLSAAGNKAALAQRLHISRPALYKRLATIEQLLGVDLDDAESLASLHVATMILDTRGRSAPATSG